MTEKRVHLNHIESMRAFAALSVAIFHFTNGPNLFFGEQVKSVTIFGAQGVEVFYMISGFIIPYSLYHSRYKIAHYFKYMGKRLVRLLPPYISTIILINIVGFCLCYFLWGCQHDVNFRLIAINAFFVADLFDNYEWINPIFATLKVELQFYILIGLLFPLFRLEEWIFPAVCLSLLLLGQYTHGHDTVLSNSPYFVIGLSVFFIKEKGWHWEYLGTVFLALASLYSFYMWQDFFVGIIGFLMLMWLPSKMRFLNFTGKISYSYYLVHGLAGGWFLYFMRASSLSINYPLIALIIALLLSWVLAFLLYFLVEKISIRFSKKIRY